MSPSEKTQARLGGATQQLAAPAGPARPAPEVERKPPQSAPRDAPAPRVQTEQAPPPQEREEPSGAPRRVRLTVARIAPWSVAKLSFLLSVALGVALVVAVALLWSVLDAMGVFSDVDGVIREVVGSESDFALMDVVGFGRILSVTVFVAVVDVVLLTALATLGALIYNGASALVGGLRLTLSDD